MSKKAGLLPITPAHLKGHYAKKLRAMAAALSEVADEMEDAGMEELPVMNQPTADDGLEYVERLLSSCTTNLAKALREKRRAELNGKS
jgi:hypothetical protein